MQIAYLGLGSNLAEPQLQLKRALLALNRLPQSHLLRTSRFYRTAPWGDVAQPDFVNAVAEIETALAPRQLLDALLTIERELGRVRTEQRWGPRIIDLDLLSYGDCMVAESGLQLPHPRMHERAFVLLPLAELAPTMPIAEYGTVQGLVRACGRSGLPGLGNKLTTELRMYGNAKSPSVRVPVPVTVPHLLSMKSRGEKIVALTAYDASFAAQLDNAGIDLALVGDSLGMVVQGRASTLPVTLDEMVYHTAAVSRGLRSALLVADLPFMTYRNPDTAAISSARLLAEGGAAMVKLEGAGHVLDIIHYLDEREVPVCAHLGLTPQSVHKLGGYRVQGKAKSDAERLLADSLAVEQAGADLLVLECVPASLAKRISAELRIPAIGIGAGVNCDGQILVLYDMLGITPGKRPRFSKDFLAESGSIELALKAYTKAVREGEFPPANTRFRNDRCKLS